MGILNEIQSAIMEPSTNLGSILLKLRFLASRLGSHQLADWVRYEAEGYPIDVTLPEYRIVGVTYTGTFFGPFGGGIQNAPIPPHLIEKFAGKNWTRHHVRSSIAAVEELVSDKDAVIGINAQDLILLLQGNIYADYACNSINGRVSQVQVSEILTTVRNRVLELTLELEKAIPEAAQVTLTMPAPKNVDNEQVTQIFNQTVYGNLTHVNASDHAAVSVNVKQGDTQALVNELVKAGIPQSDAQDFADVVANEKPQSSKQPLGSGAIDWLGKGLGKIKDGTIKMGVNVFTKVIEEAAMRYYGFK